MTKLRVYCKVITTSMKVIDYYKDPSNHVPLATSVSYSELGTGPLRCNLHHQAATIIELYMLVT